MFTEIKYIITKEKNIIVFGEAIKHSEFKHLEPIRAGFIYFKKENNGDVTCSCYGRSVSLDLDSDPSTDADIARLQLNLP
jgi:hypothetical protein